MNKLRVSLSSAALIASAWTLLSMPGPMAAQTAPITQQEAHRRAEALLKQMTVEEKVGQMNQASGVVIPGLATEKPDDIIVKGQVGSVLWQFDVKELNRMQHLAVEKSRLHIPLLIGFDVIHGYRTAFPVPLAMASSWDPECRGSSPASGCQGCSRRGRPVGVYPHGRYRARCSLGPDCGRRRRGSVSRCGNGGGAGTRISG